MPAQQLSDDYKRLVFLFGNEIAANAENKIAVFVRRRWIRFDIVADVVRYIKMPS
jgi:hypothetical protein